MRKTIDLTTSPSGFPLTAGTLDFMQQSYSETVQAVAALAGSTNVIVSGCQVSGTQIAAGWVFIGGRLLFFEGGDAGATWLMRSKVVAVSADNQNGQEVDRYLTETLELNVAGTIDFRTLRRAGTLLELQRRAASLVSFEPAVIVEGCLVSAVTTNSLAISSGVYALDGVFVEAEAYQGAFPVYFSAANGYTTADPGGTRVAFTPYASQRSQDVINRASTRRGTLVELARDVLDRFDPNTGLGKWEWTGYAIANGNNGTADLRGRFRVGHDPATLEYDTVGETGGAATVTLTEAQMPRHAHGSPNSSTLPAGEYGLMRKSVTGEDVTLAQSDTGNAGTEPDLKASPIPIPSSGGGQPHENRPPYLVTFIAQRL